MGVKISLSPRWPRMRAIRYLGSRLAASSQYFGGVCWREGAISPGIRRDRDSAHIPAWGVPAHVGSFRVVRIPAEAKTSEPSKAE